MIDFIYLQKIYKTGDIASQLSQLYEQKGRVKQKILIGKGQIPLEEAIKIQESRLRDFLLYIQKGYKTSGIED